MFQFLLFASFTTFLAVHLTTLVPSGNERYSNRSVGSGITSLSWRRGVFATITCVLIATALPQWLYKVYWLYKDKDQRLYKDKAKRSPFIPPEWMLIFANTVGTDQVVHLIPRRKKTAVGTGSKPKFSSVSSQQPPTSDQNEMTVKLLEI